jgi:hypothetical protein
MNRLTILKTLIRKKRLKNYLEIGVLNGHIFFRIRSRFKIAIDPEFTFNNSRKIGKLFLNPYNLYNRYFPIKSDDFFERDAPRLLKDKKIELALIDGMHEYEHALRDVENTLNYGDDNVVIIMHDCNPPSSEATVSFADYDARNRKGVWNGDVWKVILPPRSLRSDVCAFVLDCDHGLGVIVKKANPNVLCYTREQICRFTYEDLAANRDAWLDLRPASYWEEFIKD